MPVYKCDPAIELNGRTTLSFLTSILNSEFSTIVSRNGLDEIDPEHWYPLRKVLATLEEISQANNAMFSLVSLGMAAAENAELPPEVSKMPPAQFLKLYEQLYPTRHRNGTPGTLKVDVLDDKHVRITLDSDVPYPDDTMYGVFYGYMRRITPKNMEFAVKYDAHQRRRESGGTETVIWVVLE